MADLRHLFLKTLHPVLKPLAKFYLSRERSYKYKGITIKVFPGVFHPGLFFSTGILLDYLENKSLINKKFLELGAGSGLISAFAAKNGAVVTASDISEQAIKNINRNALLNNLKIDVIKSDLFRSIPITVFDWVIINPPYYPRNPLNEEDHAWFCGEKFEYFYKLFGDLSDYMNDASNVLIILSEDCNLSAISKIANEYKSEMTLVSERKVFGEVNYIFKIQKRY